VSLFEGLSEADSASWPLNVSTYKEEFIQMNILRTYTVMGYVITLKY
jgi:uncharacterized membrane protein YesL